MQFMKGTQQGHDKKHHKLQLAEAPVYQCPFGSIDYSLHQLLHEPQCCSV
jgi:predicted nucleotidyltransferase